MPLRPEPDPHTERNDLKNFEKTHQIPQRAFRYTRKKTDLNVEKLCSRVRKFDVSYGTLGIFSIAGYDLGPILRVLSFKGGVHIGARALHVQKFDLVWLYRLPIPVERRGVIPSFK